ncbi:unnamed protein product [Paramecium sonneborni]|uniref:UBR-type domain-containing protein n=1 Tax=Paramecium sonneborni TaxID=65129 RepID=A0A8S1N237_9CILI|nr:unnamed protein product [Paramecium sonneborni]
MQQETVEYLVEISRQISNAHKSEPRLSFKRQLHKFLEKLKSSDSLKQYQSILISYLHNAISNPLNHKLNVQQQVITILIQFFEVDQPQVCDSQTLCEVVADYVKFIIKSDFQDEYLKKQFANFIKLIFWNKKIFNVTNIEIKEIEIIDQHFNLNLKTSIFSNKSLQQLLKSYILSIEQLSEYLLSMQYPEVFLMVLDFSALKFEIPKFIKNGTFDIDCKSKLQLLPYEQQIQLFLNLKELDNEKLDIFTQLIFQNQNLDIASYVPKLIIVIVNSSQIDYDRALIILKRISNNQKFNLNYEYLRAVLIQSKENQLINFIIDAIVSFEQCTENIVKSEISKHSNPLSIIYLLIQLIKQDQFDQLYEKLLNKSISPYQYVILHVILIIQEKSIMLEPLQEQCLRFQLNEICLVQIFSFYSFQNLIIQRKIKLLSQFKQLIETEQNMSFYDILVIIGQETNQSTQINQRIGQILNREWNNISNFLKQIEYNKQSQIIQGFYYVVMYFTDQNESEFLRLFNIIRSSMCNRNKVVNYNKLINSIQQYELDKPEPQIQLYVMLLKINYLLSDNFIHRKKNGEEISERSSEFGDLNEGQEQEYYKQIQEHGKILIDKLEKTIQRYETNYLRMQKNLYLAVQIGRLLQLSDIKINIQHSLLVNEQVQNMLYEQNLIESDIIWDSLKKLQKVQLATAIIQIFKNEKSVKLMKMVVVELSKLCKYRYYALLWKQYDIFSIQQNVQQQISNITKLQMTAHKFQLILKIQDNYEFLKLAYQQVQKSQFELLALLIAISLHCGISNNLIDGMGEQNEMCINKLIVEFSCAGLLQLVLTLVKPIKQQKKKKQQMEIEKKLEDYLSNQIQDAISLVLIGIQKNLNKNQDLKQEFINLATNVYQYGQSSEYSLILDLFDKIPYELIINCLKSIQSQDKFLDQKLQHILVLINKFDKIQLTNEFYELSYDIIINSNQINQTMIEYCLQLISIIKMNENGQPQNQTNIDVQQLKEILIPENFVPTGCTQQNIQQQIYTCIQCQNNNKKNIQCCASCAFSCHQNHQIQYENMIESMCECNQTKKCNQQRQKQPIHTQQNRRLLFPPSATNTSGVLVEYFRREREIREREFKDLELHPNMKEYARIKDNFQDFDSEVELEDSLSSSQIQYHDESNNDVIEKYESSSNSIIEIEPNQFEPKEVKNYKKPQQDSKFFSKLKINFDLLFDKLIQMCNFTIQNYKSLESNYQNDLEDQEYELQSKIPHNIQKINTLISQNNIIQHKTENIDVLNELRNQQEQIQQKLGIYYVAFQIRKVIDEGDNFIAVAGHSEMKIFNKTKYFQILEKRTSGLQLPYTKVGCKPPVSTILFNPYNQKQILVVGLLEIHLIELKQDGTPQSDKAVIARFTHPISKTLWINQNMFAWLAFNSIYTFNITSSNQQCYNLNLDDKKIKDFCIINGTILCVDLQGDIYQQKLVEGQQKIPISEKVNLDDQLKGKSRDKTPYCLAKINNTSILLISYKNGASFLCTFQDKAFINIVRLDELLFSQSLDGLLASPQFISQNKNNLKFSVLAQKQNQTNQQVNFHSGRLLIIEINNKGNIGVQQIFDNFVEGYCLLKDPEYNLFALAIAENKQLISACLNLKDNVTQLCQDRKNENQDQLINQLKERFELNLLKQTSNLFNPLQNFCLAPSVLATPQQLQIGPTSITVTQGYAITGIIFNKPNVDQIEIFKYRTIQKRNNFIIIPLNYIEQIYTLLTHTITFTQNNYNNLQVYIQKMTLSQAMMTKLMSILNQDNNQMKSYIFQDIKQRNHKFKSILSEQQINLVNSLDCLGITLQAYQNPTIKFTIIPQLIAIIQQNQPIITDSAKKLLKILLKNHKALLGSEYDYRSIKDKIFIEKIKSKTSAQIIQKLQKIQSTRLPQLFYIYNQIPNVIFDILSETINYKQYSQLLLRYLQFLQNCQKDINETLSQVEDIKQLWKLSNQNMFNRTFIEELIIFQKNKKSEIFEYAWDVFPKENIQSEKIETESLEEKNKFEPYLDFDEIPIDFGDDYDPYEALLLRQELQKQQPIVNQTKKCRQIAFPTPKPAQSLLVEQQDLIKAYSQWLQKGIKSYNEQYQKGKREFQYLLQLSKQFYALAKSTKNIGVVVDYLQMIDFKGKGISSVLLLTYINGKNINDELWVVFNQNQLFLDLQIIYDVLSNLDISDQQQCRLKQKNLPLDKLRDIMKSEIESQIQLLNNLMEKKNQLLYLQIIKYLLNATKINVQMVEKLQTNQWTELICQLKINQASKQIVSTYLKQLLQQIIAKQDYYYIKDVNLYRTQLRELSKNQSLYINKQSTYQALKRILKTSKKRPQFWKEFCDENVLKIIKSLIKTYPKETLEVIEIII